MNAIEMHAMAEFEQADFRQFGMHIDSPIYMEALAGDPHLPDIKRVVEILRDQGNRKPAEIMHMLYVQHYPIDEVEKAMTAFGYVVRTFEETIRLNGKP